MASSLTLRWDDDDTADEVRRLSAEYNQYGELTDSEMFGLACACAEGVKGAQEASPDSRLPQ